MTDFVFVDRSQLPFKTEGKYCWCPQCQHIARVFDEVRTVFVCKSCDSVRPARKVYGTDAAAWDKATEFIRAEIMQ